MKNALILVVFLAATTVALGAERASAPVFDSQGKVSPQGKVDELVFARLKQLGIAPANLCSDGVFVRRVYLDVIGTLPTLKETREFLDDRSPDKRRALVDRLLEREEFADYWAMKWSDLLRVKAEFPINLWPNAAQAYHRWIRTSIQGDLPYDQFVREMLTANGSNFRVGQVNFYRAVQNRTPQGIAQAVALTFMGERTEKWPKERLAGMAAFFAQISYKPTGEWKEEIVSFDSYQANAKLRAGEGSATGDAPSSSPAATQTPATFPDGTAGQLSPLRDPRQDFADWLISAKNPWFARNLANRVWSWLLGRGIVHEPDDFRPDNPPSNPELLAYLEKELVGAKYDVKHIYRLILNSSTYQLSSVSKDSRPDAVANFAKYPIRRLDAEVLIDALNQITGTSEQYFSAIPEPFTFIPEGQRSVALPDGSITSAFLEQFGRPSRDTGLESERSNRPTPDQWLHLLNSSHIQRKIENSPRLLALLQAGPLKASTKAALSDAPVKPGKSGKSSKSSKRIKPVPLGSLRQPEEIVRDLYLTIVSREPTAEELSTVKEYFQGQSGTSKREAAMDLIWALINSAEFLYRH